jgi:dsDNA-specific endonuclease/ATPase MutS2
MDNEKTVEIPIDGVLDLHTFRPGEMKDVVTDYIAACVDRGIVRLRIIHGKGKGKLRRTVHAMLTRDPHVAAFRLAGEDEGGWGATVVEVVAPAVSPQQ